MLLVLVPNAFLVLIGEALLLGVLYHFPIHFRTYFLLRLCNKKLAVFGPRQVQLLGRVQVKQELRNRVEDDPEECY